MGQFIAADVHDAAVAQADLDAATGAAEPADRLVPAVGGPLGQQGLERQPGARANHIGRGHPAHGGYLPPEAVPESGGTQPPYLRRKSR